MEFSKTQTKVQIEEKMIVCIPVAGYQVYLSICLLVVLFHEYSLINILCLTGEDRIIRCPYSASSPKQVMLSSFTI
ncbi:hypothetical protein HanXRQr2_Chr05g0221191 [Helianthus annuus]|uniref:Uncharacterized protein n=1 Tax=Helianthus annuus TaxID=4232 RepID=A0A9K3J159_HELAN|nr:hypothetical protein HanXRQr2_Chr05g0221191 [Helianthus annuus]KAJ0923254.1 hypothetical protein HanPSC8_Chr05g0213661 [Helianthus annuus]